MNPLSWSDMCQTLGKKNNLAERCLILHLDTCEECWKALQTSIGPPTKVLCDDGKRLLQDWRDSKAGDGESI